MGKNGELILPVNTVAYNMMHILLAQYIVNLRCSLLYAVVNAYVQI